MKKRATIIDVARVANVSLKTVSRVINREPNVSKETLSRVTAAVRELDYRPNVAARSLAGSSAYLIGTFACNPSPHYQMALHSGAARVCSQRGFHLVLEALDIDAPDLAVRFERSLRSAVFRGVVMAPPIVNRSDLLDILDQIGMRYVRIDPTENPGRSDVIVARDADGIAALVRHLWALGHRRFAVVGGPSQHRATAVRQAAFRETLAALGGDLRKVAHASGDFGFPSGMAAGRALLRRKSRPTAVIALNDDMAAGVIAAASEAGVTVPGELSVAGFDDSSIAQQVWPPLTTVRQPITRLAEIAVELLTDPVHAGPARLFECDVELVVRQSTGPAPAA